MGITTVAEAEEMESDLLVRAYYASLDWVDFSRNFSVEMIMEMHRSWLGSLYPMAGTLRTVNVSKAGFPFCLAPYLGSELARFDATELKACTPCDGSIAVVAQKVSIVHAELMLIHPFREGNGRLGRWLADLMVLQSGHAVPEYELDEVSKREAYYSALRKAYVGNVSSLSDLFVDWISLGQ